MLLYTKTDTGNIGSAIAEEGIVAAIRPCQLAGDGEKQRVALQAPGHKDDVFPFRVDGSSRLGNVVR